jgi:O-antigen ligase
MYWHRTRDPLFKLVGVIAFVWALIALILAQTRSTLMAFVLFLLVFFLFGVRGLTKVMWATGLAILGFLGATLAGQAILAFLQRGQDLEGFFTLSGRTYLLSFLMDHWRDSPLLGWGFQAGSRYFAVQFMEQTGMNMGAAHDAISKILVDLGLLGGVVLLHAVGSLLLALGWLYRRLPRDQWLFLLSLGLYGLANSAFGAGVADSAPIWVVLFLTPSLALSFCHPLKGTPRGD